MDAAVLTYSMLLCLLQDLWQVGTSSVAHNSLEPSCPVKLVSCLYFTFICLEGTKQGFFPRNFTSGKAGGKTTSSKLTRMHSFGFYWGDGVLYTCL